MPPTGEDLQQWLLLAALATAAIAGLWVSVLGRGPQLHWRRAWRAARARPADAVLRLLVAVGPGALLGLTTAIALGGMGAVGWLWLLALCSTALRWGALAAGPSARKPAPSWRRWPWLPLGALAFLGLHLSVSAPALAALLPGQTRWIAFGALLLGGLLPLAGARRTAPFLAVMGAAGTCAVAIALGLAAAVDPSEVAALPGRAIGEVLDGSPPVPPFVGALAAELLRLAVLNVGGALLPGSGLLPWLQHPRQDRAEAAASTVLELPLLLLLGWLAGSAVAATGVHYEPIEVHRPLAGATIYRGGFETPSQRLEPERRHRGYVRIREGKMVDVPLRVGDWQGTFESPRFELNGRPADLALHLNEHGRPIRVLMPAEHGALAEVPLQRLRAVTIVGKHLPNGPMLFARLTERSIAPPWARGAAWLGLLLWLAAAAGAWSLALGGALPHGLTERTRTGTALLVLGLGGAAWSLLPHGVPWLRAGLWSGAALALLGAWRALRARPKG